MLSIPHMIVLFVVVLVVFGPSKLPELARGLGKLMAEFRKASGDFKSAFEQEMRDMERQQQVAERKKAAEATVAAAAAEPAQPATLATAPGTESTESGAALSSSGSLEPVVSPVSEAVPHNNGAENEDATEATAAAPPPEPTIGKPAAVGETHDSPHDIQHTA
jgi:sec-independent protein translocase protein TatB